MKSVITSIVSAALLLLFLAGGACSFTQIDPGNVGVVTLFGKVDSEVLSNGTHFINPFSTVHEYTTQWQGIHEQKVEVPSQDQLTTLIDVSVTYRIRPESAKDILLNTGSQRQLLEVHLHPRLRSVLREQGKGVARAEDFFAEQTQMNLQTAIKAELAASWQAIGVEVGDIMLRNIELPPFINAAIERKKEREQATEQQRNELERFKVEQEQKLAQATAERQAAEEMALQIRAMADAQAYEIETRGKAVRSNPQYLQAQWIERWDGKLPQVVTGDQQGLMFTMPR
jgi:regulator of protease activity HflC (stomatin/prohibitin superfamily)